VYRDDVCNSQLDIRVGTGRCFIAQAMENPGVTQECTVTLRSAHRSHGTNRQGAAGTVRLLVLFLDRMFSARPDLPRHKIEPDNLVATRLPYSNAIAAAAAAESDNGSGSAADCSRLSLVKPGVLRVRLASSINLPSPHNLGAEPYVSLSLLPWGDVKIDSKFLASGGGGGSDTDCTHDLRYYGNLPDGTQPLLVVKLMQPCTGAGGCNVDGTTTRTPVIMATGVHSVRRHLEKVRLTETIQVSQSLVRWLVGSFCVCVVFGLRGYLGVVVCVRSQRESIKRDITTVQQY
jgi:hypothetical protein